MDLILLDADSRIKLFDYITELYNEEITDIPCSQISFRDYMCNFENLKISNWYKKEENYWKEKIKDYGTRPKLMFECKSSDIDNPIFSSHTIIVKKDKWLKFKTKCIDNSMSPASALLYLFGIVIQRWSEGSSFLITLTLFNRLNVHDDAFKLFGDFTSTLFYNFERQNGKFTDILKDCNKNLWKDIENSRIYNGIEAQREYTRTNNINLKEAVSPIVFTCRTTGLNEKSADLENIYLIDKTEEIGLRHWEAQTSQAWIDLQAIDRGDYFESKWLYVTQLFKEETIQYFNTAYCSLIEYLADNDWNTCIPEILPQYQKDLIEKVNDTNQKDILPTLTMHGSFIKTALKKPSLVAIVSEKGQYTYNELLTFSSKIAHRLIEDGANNNELTAVFCEKGFEQVASCIGIMEAGSAYLPLNTEWPIDRIENVLEQGNTKIILTTKDAFNGSELNKLSDKYKIYFTDNDDEWNSYSGKPLCLPVDLNGVAYVIFTSGSTGTPKGVTISHYSAMNTINDINSRFDITSRDSVFAISNLSFDLSAYDIFGLLAVGGRVVFPSSEFIKEPENWLEHIIENNISIWNTVPMLMHMLVEHIDTLEDSQKKEVENTLRLILLSGDWISPELPERIKKYFPYSKVISLGGATEGSIWSILYPIHEIPDSWKSIPYGKAMYNQKMYVLNDFLEFTPIGVTGEVHIGGVGVALNYWNDIERTNESFIEHNRLGRLYKTGDLGVLREDGNIEFIGRKDTQVKVGGHRIELGEIEKTIENYPLVKNAAVDVVGDKFGMRHIAAYVVPKNQMDKLNFKLSRPGIRKNGFRDGEIVLPEISLSEEVEKLYFARKSYRSFTKEKLDINELSKNILESEAHLNIISNPQVCNYDIDKLGILCSLFHGYISEELVLPKYRYPSAGSFYPIRIYLKIYKEFSGLAKGIYYYQPDYHKLLKISEMEVLEDAKVFDILFSSYLPALEPAYGEWSVPFSYLEAGYMLKLLHNEAENLNLNYDINLLEETQNRELDILSVSFCEKKAENTSLLGQVNKYYLKKQSNKFTLYEWKDNNFIKLEEWETEFKFGQTGDNLAIFNDASGYILYSASNKAEYVTSGTESQYLMDNSWKHKTGYCAIGSFETDSILKKYLGKNILHTALAIGKITNEQIENRRTSQADNLDEFVSDTPVDELKKYIGDKLPGYMMPSYFTFLDELPLTPNGKVDRKALPKVEESKKKTDQSFAPESDIEKGIHDIWCEVLGIERISIKDSFFVIGGDSLSVIKAVNKIKKKYSITGNFVGQIYKTPNIQELGKYLQDVIANEEDF
jgi:amino acid adenylation domain-containing protein